MDWSVVDSENADDNAAVTLELKDGPYSRSMWDFAFHALYKVFFCQFLFFLLLQTHSCRLLTKVPFLLTVFWFLVLGCFKVVVGADCLSTELKITNTDNKPFSFNTALHTYFRVSFL